MCTYAKEKHMGLLYRFIHPNQCISLINITNHSTLRILQQISARCAVD